MHDTIKKLRKVLQDSVDSTPERVSAFFKTSAGDYAERDRFIGITVPVLRKIAKNFLQFALEDLSLLIQSPMNEERLLALIILTQKYQTSEEEQKGEIYKFYIANLLHINNWNLVDSSAHLIVGAHLFQFQLDRSLLEEFAVSKNLWVRRIAIVATWYFIRKSELDWTFRIAKSLQNDPHNLIHKAVGWMLREAGKRDQAQLITFLDQHMNSIQRTTLRYAIEKFPETIRKSYLAKEKGLN